MELPVIHFNPLHFANAGYENSDDEYASDDRALLRAIRSVCPELSEWVIYQLVLHGVVIRKMFIYCHGWNKIKKPLVVIN